MNFVKDKEWLLKNLHDRNVRIVDCSFSLADPDKGRRDYGISHLPGAVYFDLEKDLSGQISDHGGRHPLPNMEELVLKLEEAGISEKTTVIAYDYGEGAYAARFWWMLHYLGHENVFVLDGGFKEWNGSNYPVTKESPVFAKTTFKVNVKAELLSNVEEVKAVVNGQVSNVVLIDSREEKRYLGLEEPIDKKAGHIPGAINKPWFEGLQNGHYKTTEQQKQRFSELDANNQLIVYCGSGVTAVPNFLALKEAGFNQVKLYLGSFSDWISYQENEIN
jgi:thiosulfate/3-mercaptopyruvate sulfurtransferase